MHSQTTALLFAGVVMLAVVMSAAHSPVNAGQESGVPATVPEYQDSPLFEASLRTSIEQIEGKSVSGSHQGNEVAQVPGQAPGQGPGGPQDIQTKDPRECTLPTLNDGNTCTSTCMSTCFHTCQNTCRMHTCIPGWRNCVTTSSGYTCGATCGNTCGAGCERPTNNITVCGSCTNPN